jgi:hypothetical protein
MWDIARDGNSLAQRASEDGALTKGPPSRLDGRQPFASRKITSLQLSPGPCIAPSRSTTVRSSQTRRSPFSLTAFSPLSRFGLRALAAGFFGAVRGGAALPGAGHAPAPKSSWRARREAQ